MFPAAPSGRDPAMMLRAWGLMAFSVALTSNAVLFANPVAKPEIDGTATPSLTQDYYQIRTPRLAASERIPRTDTTQPAPPTAKVILAALRPLLVTPF